MENKINVLVAGDFCPINRLSNWESHKESFEALRNYLKEFDLRIVNLECPVSDRNLKPIVKTGPNLICTQNSAGLLNHLGINMVTLANNHIKDYGRDGLEDTILFLYSKKIEYVGAGLTHIEAVSTKYINKNNLKIAVINIADNEWSTTTEQNKSGAHPLDSVSNYYTIIDAKKNADYVLVIVHGGHEMYNLPSPQMKKLYRFFIDSGADAVVNHHTHVPSGTEIYKNKPIYYSTGNFLFDLPDKRVGDWTIGLFVHLTFSGDGIKHSYKSFNQSNKDKLFYFIDENNDAIAKGIDKLNIIIADDTLLKKNFKNYLKKVKKLYLNYIEPFSNKYLNFLQNKKIIPSFLSKRKKMLLLNLSRCEAHRDILMKILSDEISNS